MTGHSWYLQGWFLATVTAVVWAGAYLWYVALGTRPLSEVWTAAVRRRREARVAARESVPNATDPPQV